MKGSTKVFSCKPVILIVGGELLQAQTNPLVASALAERQRIVAKSNDLPFVQNILHWGGRLGNLHFLGHPFTGRTLHEVAASLHLDVRVSERNVIRLSPAADAARQLQEMLRPQNDAVMVVLAKEVEIYLRPKLIAQLSSPA